jgi:hypothetical protein
MAKPINILLQTTIHAIKDDWHIGRFSLLQSFLEGLVSSDGTRCFHIAARDRVPSGQPDPILSTLASSDFDELWLFAVDTGDGLTEQDAEGISGFRRRGGGLMVTRDHMDLGCSVCHLNDIGAAHHFHSRNPDPNPARHCLDDSHSTEILWPNYHSGANGDYQEIQVSGALHPVLAGGVRYLPAHPHEGGVSAPVDDPQARVIATGQSKTTGSAFNIAVAFERTATNGPAIAQSTFHHFADYNWDTRMGAPSFVDEPPSQGFARFPEARRSTERFIANMASWLAR